jgi:hypothetical protein
MSAFDHFLGELCADPELAPCASEINHALTELDLEADTNLDAMVLYEAVCWILNQRQHSVGERMEKVHALTALKGRQVINLREWTGW